MQRRLVKYDPQNRRHILLAPSKQHADATHPPAKAAPDLAGQLERLGQMRQAGQLTVEEYEAGKRKLLG